MGWWNHWIGPLVCSWQQHVSPSASHMPPSKDPCYQRRLQSVPPLLWLDGSHVVNPSSTWCLQCVSVWISTHTLLHGYLLCCPCASPVNKQYPSIQTAWGLQRKGSRSQGKRLGTPWTGHQSVPGPTCGDKPFTLTPTSERHLCLDCGRKLENTHTGKDADSTHKHLTPVIRFSDWQETVLSGSLINVYNM